MATENIGWASRPVISTRSRSIWRWQLVLAFSAVAIAAVVALLIPDLFTSPPYVSGMLLLIAVTLVAMALPWERLPKGLILIVPFADILAIGSMASASDNRLGFLWVFPIAWIATYYAYPWLALGIGTVTATLLVSSIASGFTAASTLRLLVIVICLGFIGTTIMIGSDRARASSRLLRRQSEHLQRTIGRLRMQEQRGTAMLDALRSAVAQIDDRGRVRATNSAYRRLYGLDGLPQGHPSRSVEYAARRGDPLAPDQMTVARAARGETFESERVWLFDPNGEWRALSMSVQRIHEDGHSDMMIVADDVTEQENAALERHSLARIVTHELRNPLTAIVGHSDLLLERDDLLPEVRDQTQVIQRAAERMQQMVAGILEERAMPSDDCDAVLDLRSVIDASVEAFGAAAAIAGVDLAQHVEGPLPLVGDTFRLRQVVDNIVSNAIKYTPRGGRVTIEARADDDGVLLTVSDTGIGIAQADLPRIFDKYFRAESARANALPGSGLGLGIARDIVTEHGGSLGISSDLGHGTRVDVRLNARRGTDVSLLASDAA
ncbi:ATP-binding protein [Microbacterium betulae]|uniref:histidine kinase n=1 Tax=Microbacterium betulae TaxID=2981139 RepID=A0AA97FER0_9MICO|nr:ATP-binding protein [Microbacterium sp. AB]WOF22271.1 ATP-binding protein [Microbacterium sp. AB]